MKLGLLSVLVILLTGSGDLSKLLEKIGSEKSPERRLELVRDLSGSETARAAAALAKIVANDVSPDVRVAAAKALGASGAENASGLLLDLLRKGGIRRVRRAVGHGLSGRPGGTDAVLRLLDESSGDQLTRGLCVEALGAAPGPAALHRLLKLAAGDDVFLRCEALRAIAARSDGDRELIPLLHSILRKHRDTPTVMSAIDLVERRPALELRSAMENLRTFLDPVVSRAVAHALAVLRYRQALRDAAAAAGAIEEKGYEFSPDDDPPMPPPPRPRFDLVYGFDSTGSVSTHLPVIRKQLRARHRFLVEIGADVRVGVVVFRDDRRMRKYPSIQLQPLTHDLVAVEAFLEGIRAGGADSQGAAVSRGLKEGLGRMGWRENARGSFTLIADSKLDHPVLCRRMARLHLMADGVGVKVFYLLRTRASIPEGVRALAEAGGSAMEIME